MAFTPGPNNMHADGIRRQFRLGAHRRRTWPGVVVGYAVLLCACGRRARRADRRRFRRSRRCSKIVGAAYMLWLAWKVANAGTAAATDERATRQPLTLSGRPRRFSGSIRRALDHRAWAPSALYVHPETRDPRLCDHAGRVHGWRRLLSTVDLGRLRRGAAQTVLRDRAPRPHLQHRHGAAAGRQHRADGALAARRALSLPEHLSDVSQAS